MIHHRKGVSFLSRIPGFNKSKPRGESTLDEEDDQDVGWRPEGMDAQLFSHSVTNVGFNPKHPQPPGYIKVRARFKKERDFDRMFLAQELKCGKTHTASQNAAEVKQTEASETASLAGEKASGLGRIRTTDSQAGNEAIWAVEFSRDGKYLAAAGQDKIVRVWAVLSSREERRMHEKDEEQTNGSTDNASAEHLSAPVFRKTPYREYEGHTSTVIDLSWSKNNFLLSSSFDKTVRLWHVSRQECLVTFKHAEYCPSIQFHPRDDRFFLAGSLDTKLRLWSIPDKSVAFWQQLPEMITAVAFTPDGKTAIAGTIGGTCLFYDTEGLKYKTQIQVKSSGRNAKPAKITGIQAINWSDDNPVGSGSSKGSVNTPYSPTGSVRREVKLLISSNDSRVRLYNYRDKNLEMKFKGHKNLASQIKALFSDDARFVISGSEDCKTYLWGTGPSQDSEKNRPLEFFEAHNAMTTGAVFAPRKTRMALSSSEDPVFDLCNPPPVTLLSRSESVRTGSNASGHGYPGRDSPERNGDSSIQPTPATAEGGGTFKRAEETPAYLTRTAHLGGHILVTADYAGNIKIFRQDCAYNKRRDSNWDSASMFSRHSRRQGSSIGGGIGRLGRSFTQASRGSNAGSVNSSRSRAGSNATQPAGERILNWRQQVHEPNASAAASTGSLDTGSSALRARAFKGNRDRSASPRKSLGATSIISKTESKSSLRNILPIHHHNDPGHNHHLLDSTGSPPKEAISTPDLRVTSASPVSPDTAHSRHSSDLARATSSLSSQALSSHTTTDATPTTSIGSPLATNVPMVQSPAPMTGADEQVLDAEKAKIEDTNPLWLQGGRSYVFWNSEGHRARSSDSGPRPPDPRGAGAHAHPDTSHLGVPQTPGTELAPMMSAVSKLSSEGTSPADSSHDEAEGEGSELRCMHCGSTSFKARLMTGATGKGREHRLVCQRCGTPAG